MERRKNERISSPCVRIKDLMKDFMFEDEVRKEKWNIWLEIYVNFQYECEHVVLLHSIVKPFLYYESLFEHLVWSIAAWIVNLFFYSSYCWIRSRLFNSRNQISLLLLIFSNSFPTLFMSAVICTSYVK